MCCLGTDKSNCGYNILAAQAALQNTCVMVMCRRVMRESLNGARMEPQILTVQATSRPNSVYKIG